MKETISPEAQHIVDSYLQLHFKAERKKVTAPYCMNLKKQRGGLRVMIGKGSSEEIIQEVRVWAQVKGFKLKRATPEQIREFMIERGIGIDCSGFATYVINAELKTLGMKPLWHYIKYTHNDLLSKIRRLLRPVENISANLMTNEDNCIKITDINDIKPLDLIRAKGKQKNAHHIGVITSIERDKNGIVKSFEYANSHRYYDDQNGVRIGKVTITDPKKELKDQKWEDIYNGHNYFLEDLLVDYKDNGIRRLKCLVS